MLKDTKCCNHNVILINSFTQELYPSPILIINKSYDGFVAASGNNDFHLFVAVINDNLFGF